MCHIEKTFKRKNVYYKKKLLIINFVIYSWNPSAKKIVEDIKLLSITFLL